MPALWKKTAWWSLLLLTAGTATTTAQQITPADQMCRPEQLSGQYECVTSVPLSEEEVRISLAYLAALRSLGGEGPWDEERPMASVVAAHARAPARDRQ
jgi:hypothetical protein